MTTPKATLMVPAILLLQILKRVGVYPGTFDEKIVSDVLDLLCAVGGIYGLYYAIKADPKKCALPEDGTSPEKTDVATKLP